MKRFLLAGAALLIVAAPAALFLASQGPGPGLSGVLNYAGRLIGFIAPAVILIQMALGTRFRAVERGIGLDILLAVHRKWGLIFGSLLLLHPACLLTAEQLSGYQEPFGTTKATGVAAYCVILASLASPLLIRRIASNYRTWVLFHRAAYLAFPFALVHGFLIRPGTPAALFKIYWGLAALGYLFILSHRIVRSIPWPKNVFKVADIKAESPGINTIQLKGRAFPHRAGQFAFLSLEKGRLFGEPHPFTISSAPGDRCLLITIKAVGDFTGAISRQTSGRRAFLEGPYGNFLLPEDISVPVVLMAGGIGITPFLSMLRHARNTGQSRKITLFWANKHLEDAFCRAELEEITAAVNGIGIIYVFSQEPEWKGEKGRISKELLIRHISEPFKATYYLCGPPGFMAAARSILQGVGVPKASVKWERFSFI